MCTVLSTIVAVVFLQYNFMDPGWGRIFYGGRPPAGAGAEISKNAPQLLTPTTVAGVKRISASVCVSVFPHDKTKTAEITITKLPQG